MQVRHKTGRWAQRADNFARALAQLREAVALANTRELSRLEAQGLIQGFEDTHDLAWHTLRDFLVERGQVELYGSKDTTREAFKGRLNRAGGKLDGYDPQSQFDTPHLRRGYR